MGNDPTNSTDPKGEWRAPWWSPYEALKAADPNQCPKSARKKLKTLKGLAEDYCYRYQYDDRSPAARNAEKQCRKYAENAEDYFKDYCGENPERPLSDEFVWIPAERSLRDIVDFCRSPIECKAITIGNVLVTVVGYAKDVKDVKACLLLAEGAPVCILTTVGIELATNLVQTQAVNYFKEKYDCK